MTFTDDDLAVLKELSKASVYWSPKIPALLARLEAAELALEHFIDSTPISDEETLLDREIGAWRKEAGK